MKGFFGDIWNSLKLSATKSGESILQGVGYRYLNRGDGRLIYVNNRAYKSVAIYTAQRIAAQAITAEINKLFPRYQKYLLDKVRQPILAQQQKNWKELLKEGTDSTIEYGKIWMADAKKYLWAKDKYGNVVRESLMIYYDMDKPISQTIQDRDVSQSYQSKTLCFIDLAPTVTVQSSKNLITTTVQGRNFTRKELISGGDITFSVSGNITLDKPGVYPKNDVKKFIQIMQYGGIVKVHHFKFGAFNIEQILIKDFQLGQSDCKNMQPYSFTCVAVEPSEAVQVYSDTIGVLNQKIVTAELDWWYNLILNSKLAEAAANVVTSTASSLAGAGISSGGQALDNLIPNI